MTGDYFIINYFHIQILIAEILFCLKDKKRKYFCVRFIPSVIVYCLIPFIIPGGFFSAFVTVGSWFTFGFMIMMLLSFALIVFCFDIPVAQVVFYVCVSHTLQHLVSCIYNFTVNILSLDVLKGQVCLLVSCVCIYVIAYIFLVKRIQKDNIIDLTSPTLIVFSVLSSLLIYIFSLWTSSQETFTYGSIVYESFSCVLIIIILFDLFENRKLKQSETIMMHLLHQEVQQHELSKNNIEIINRKCHDLKNQIIALNHMENSEERKHILSGIENDIMIYDSFAKTDNKELDILFAEKALQSEALGIQIRYMADGSLFSFINTGDLYSLIGNALDNAIEAVSLIEDKDYRIISLNASKKFNFLSIHIENPCFSKINFVDGLPSTTKPDKNYHGFGLKSIKYISQKYGGDMTCKVENNTFSLDILIPLTTGM